ncbi:amino acid synthesis family protein [Pseudooceanicola sp. C21-150M6]|uniref:amino acid synthesis family protein n=1 Tax=Pseudooceanicola sp. C21-150M6 TaxID=3434355 RepID=UPI003D7FA828
MSSEDWSPRRITVTEDTCLRDAGRPVDPPLRRLAVAAILPNPCAGGWDQDLAALRTLGKTAGTELTRIGCQNLGTGAIQSYGKAVLVGLGGELEHAAAILHVGFVPGLRAVLPSSSLMPATKRVCAPGAEITVPLGHIHDAWSPEHWDAMHLTMTDGPAQDELAIILVLTTGGRPNFRVGDHRPEAHWPEV